ncbi:MAG: hypothetical protein OEZ06_13705 [Myxococcales bacterium]|nr:hypothetical protein [Myxococcales bacterium]
MNAFENRAAARPYTGAIFRRLSVTDSRDVITAVSHMRAMCLRAGLPQIRRSVAIVAVHQLAENIVQHSKGGAMELTLGGDRRRLRITAHDEGPGIVDVQALLQQTRTRGPQGLSGLGILQRLAHMFDMRSTPDGTVVRLMIDLEQGAASDVRSDNDPESASPHARISGICYRGVTFTSAQPLSATRTRR